MGLMFQWATKEYLLKKMSLRQIIFYYNYGWEAKQTEAKVHWGTYGQLMSGETNEPQNKKRTGVPIEEIRRYPGYETAYYNEKGKLIKE